MNKHTSRRTSCPSRLLTADGRTLVCDHRHSDDRMWEERDDPRAVMHYVCWPDSAIVKYSWPDDDPCAWDADVRATTAGLCAHFEDDFDYEDTETFIDAVVGMAAGRAYLRRKLAEHDASVGELNDDWELAADRHVARCDACKHWCGWCNPLECDYGPQPRTVDLNAHVADVGEVHGQPECYPDPTTSDQPTEDGGAT